MKKLICTLFITLFCTSSFATETCSRIALINNQEVLVDSNSTDKGEGLRYHLEKDAVALEYLNKYQKNSSYFWPNALLGTAGTGLMFLGLFSNNSADKEIYFISGVSALLINFLMAKTLEVTNEVNLSKSIDEYNKRNLPKIYFSPDENRSQTEFFQYKVGFLKSWSY